MSVHLISSCSSSRPAVLPLVLWSIMALGAPVEKLAGQQPLAAEVAALARRCAQELGEHAAACAQQGYGEWARQLWGEIQSEYAGDAGKASPEPAAAPAGSVPRPDGRRRLAERWAQLASRLGVAHRDLGIALLAAGDAAGARRQFERARRFQPDDPVLHEQLQLTAREGLVGTEFELQMLAGSRRLAVVVGRVRGQTFAAAAVERRDPRLDKMKISYRAAASEHFVVFGDWPIEALLDVAVAAERCRALCVELLGATDLATPPAIACLRDHNAFASAVRGNYVPDAAWIVAHAQACDVAGEADPAGGPLPLLHSAVGTTFVDFAVRRTAQMAFGCDSDLLREGVGHAVTGALLGRNVILGVALPDPSGTAAGDDGRAALPDLAVWQQLAREQAFARAGTPLPALLRTTIDRMTSGQRIQAWSLCDHLLRRGPTMLRALDRTVVASRDAAGLAAAAPAALGVDLAVLEAERRRCLVDETPVLRAARGEELPFAAPVDGAQAWLAAINRQRERRGLAAVGWSQEASQRAAMGAADEQQFVPGVLRWSGDANPTRALNDWWLLPRFRDVLLDPELSAIGVATAAAGVFFEVRSWRATRGAADMAVFPAVGEKAALPRKVAAKDLAPELRARLAGRGVEVADAEVGLPLSAHFFGQPDGAVTCRVLARGVDVDGVLVAGMTTVPAIGLVVFVPLQPLPRGGVVAEWSCGERRTVVEFTAR